MIRKNGEYLVGKVLYSDELRWSNSIWDAWRTRDRELARKVALRTGGVRMLFNPVAGQVKVL